MSTWIDDSVEEFDPLEVDLDIRSGPLEESFTKEEGGHDRSSGSSDVCENILKR